MLKYVFIATLLLLPSISRADHVFRLDGGIYNGRIARTQSGNTVPFNTQVSTYYGGEFQWGGPHLRVLVGGSFYDYKAKTVSANATDATEVMYGDGKLGAVLASQCCELRLIYSRYQTPYTIQPDPTSLQPLTVFADYIRGEAILNAKAANFRLQFDYYFAEMIANPDLGNGVMTSNYFLGGCARIFLGGDKFRYGPAICIDLQELYLPQSVTIYRQEVHGRMAVEF